MSTGDGFGSDEGTAQVCQPSKSARDCCTNSFTGVIELVGPTGRDCYNIFAAMDISKFPLHATDCRSKELDSSINRASFTILERQNEVCN